jgi:hypothetical protein
MSTLVYCVVAAWRIWRSMLVAQHFSLKRRLSATTPIFPHVILAYQNSEINIMSDVLVDDIH